MDFDKLNDLKIKYSDKAEEQNEIIKNLEDELINKSYLSEKSKLIRTMVFTGISFLILTLTSKGLISSNPALMSFLLPILSTGVGTLISKCYEKVFLNFGDENKKTNMRLLEESLEKNIEEEISINKQKIYVLCNHDFYAKEKIDEKLIKSGVDIDKNNKISLEELKEKIVSLKVIEDESFDLLKMLCAKKMMLVYFDSYKDNKLNKLKEFFKTNIALLTTMVLTMIHFVFIKVPVDILSLLVSSSAVSLVYSNFLIKDNKDNFDVYNEIKEKYNYKELASYETIRDINCKIELLVAELSKTINMIEEEKINLEEKKNELQNDNVLEDYKSDKLSEDKKIIK
ncbi:MAG: hypothetical protein PUC23_04215 [bacterium]|nr:hypothetical protein [bacterium]